MGDGVTTNDGKDFTTGALRAHLQRIAFVRLTESIGAIAAGTVVAAQYWGNGQVALTSFPLGVVEVVVAHDVHGTWLDLAAVKSVDPSWVNVRDV